MPRAYHPYSEKHKHPKGFGSLCPRMPTDVAEDLLEKAVPVDGLGEGKLWAAAGEWCFCAHRSPHAGPDAWHGFPVIGGDVDERVLNKLEEVGLINSREKRRLRSQRKLPDTWQ